MSTRDILTHLIAELHRQETALSATAKASPEISIQRLRYECRGEGLRVARLLIEAQLRTI